MGRLSIRRLASAGLLVAVLGAPPVVSADHTSAATFGPGSALPTYGDGIAFSQEVELSSRPQRVELALSLPGSPGAFLIELPSVPDAGRTTLSYDYDVAIDGHLLPNTPISARWVLTFDDGSLVEASDPVRAVYRDTRFEWRTRTGDIVRVHWHEGGDEFGQRALEIGERAVRETADLLGVRETEPIDFFIYGDQSSFRDALGPGTRENVGGQANAEIRTLFALIRPAEIDDAWVSIVIPHELVHLVFDTAVDNPYHFPPKWLNEGLAVYLSAGYDESQRADVERAVETGNLVPLDGLTGQFPPLDGFGLAYAESASAIAFMVDTHGRDTLIQLIRSYAAGRTDDEAFEGALGMDMAAFDAAWRENLGAPEPVLHGPRPAPPAPQPSDWSGSPQPAESASPQAPTPGATRTPSTGVTGDGRDDGRGTMMLAGVAVLLVVGILVLVRLRTRAGGSRT